MNMTLFQKWSVATPAEPSTSLVFPLLTAQLAAAQAAGKTGRLAHRLARPVPQRLEAAERLSALLGRSRPTPDCCAALAGAFHPDGAGAVAAAGMAEEPMKPPLTLAFQGSFKRP
jgi:hypothetical protein